jgi:uncharacterized protein with gpF-like domain
VPEDRWLGERWRALAGIVRAEQQLYAAYWSILTRWLARIREAVFGSGHTIDPVRIGAFTPMYERAVAELVDVQVREIVDTAYFQVVGEHLDDADPYVLRHLAEVRNRMVDTPDHVFALVRDESARAVREGDGSDELALRLGKIFDESGIANWPSRAMTVARTETLGAYNGGMFRGFASIAAQTGGAWEKQWLATLDHRTRETHAHDTGADGQRVALMEPFVVGGFPLMFPGDPDGPPQEVINCRCSMMLLRPGEQVNEAGRFTRGLP